ncbi:hypothetical protein KHQ06_25230 [Nocardia tengchongensis]|uniref:Uncharacterized protein n=1 Tax=Nocardia tengchongensis TaxID=2055889 RepID=A0ABX8CI51_9NOCA|nr:hypothetical protein [Nocardia tengchongensis]QVI19652.1 hypothetical protein KHQ06_25230 [Nocardia tengchongensis]
MFDSAQPIQLRRPTTPVTIGGHDRKNRVHHRAVSASTGPTRPSLDTTLHDHAAALARQHPGVPLPNEGMPYPNSDEYAVSDESPARIEALTAQLIDDFFGTPMETREIAWLSRKAIEYGVRIHRTPAISAAIGRADPAQVRAVGRHLIRTSTVESPTVLGMAMLAEVGTSEDVSLIQILGLLSGTFGPLAADALARLPNATTSLIWLADRSAGWGRVYLVEAICRLGDPAAEQWLLRKPCDGNHLNGYFAYKVVCATPVHEAIALPELDEQIVDHTGRLLVALVWSLGMGGTLLDYDHAEQVLADYLSQLCRLEPSRSRNYAVQTLSEFLDGDAYLLPPEWASLESLRIAYRSLATARRLG